MFQIAVAFLHFPNCLHQIFGSSVFYDLRHGADLKGLQNYVGVAVHAQDDDWDAAFVRINAPN
jgi:hypothetical protein